MDEATMQRIRDCLPPPRPLPPPQSSKETATRSSAAAAAEVAPPGAAGAAAGAAAAAAAATAAAETTAPKPPKDLCCPIILELFRDPVTASDGETYERSAIEEHFRVKQAAIDAAKRELEETHYESERALRILRTGITSPMGHGRLESTALVPARGMKRLADKWRAENLET